MHPHPSRARSLPPARARRDRSRLGARSLLVPAVALAAVSALVGGAVTASAVTSPPPRTALPAAATRGPAVVRPAVAGRVRWLGVTRAGTAPTTAQCVAAQHLRCYSPVQYAKAYDWDALHRASVTGKGRTVAVVEAFGSPTVTADLRSFDSAFGLPDPPSVSTVAPAGALPRFDARDPEMTGWAAETTLDVEYAHAAAPGARILVVAVPLRGGADLGFGSLMTAERYVVAHRLADVVSQSFGAPEADFGSSSALQALRGAFAAASTAGVSVLASSGDTGVSGPRRDGSPFTTRVASWPSSDPLVTSVGGTQLSLGATGARVAPDRVWNDGHGAAGGGVSSVFTRPAFQSSVRTVVGARRGTPDVALSAAVDGAALVWSTFDPAHRGWSLVGGTSEACPLFAGVVAMADQVAGHPLGAVDPVLYAAAARPGSGLVDVTAGDNGFAGVAGYRAARGYDLASGWGGIDAGVLVRLLAKG